MNKDPLLRSSEDVVRVLFRRFGQAANGFTTEDAIAAAANIILNALRQSYPQQSKAEARFDELFGRMKAILLMHYQNGKRLDGAFPFTQTIQANLHADKNKFGGDASN